MVSEPNCADCPTFTVSTRVLRVHLVEHLQHRAGLRQPGGRRRLRRRLWCCWAGGDLAGAAATGDCAAGGSSGVAVIGARRLA